MSARLILAVSMILTLMISPAARGQASKSGPPAASASAAPSPGSGASSSTASIESQILAYQALQNVANNLASTVCKSTGIDADNSVIVIYDQTTFASLQAYEAFTSNIKVVSSAYQTLIPASFDLKGALNKLSEERGKHFLDLAKLESNQEKKKQYEYQSKELLLLSIAPIDPLADAASLITALAIASNTESPGQVTIPDSAMAVALTKQIKQACANKITVVYPPLFGNNSSSDYASADIQVAIQRLDDIRTIALQQVSEGNAKFLANYPSQKTVNKETTQGQSATNQTVDKTGTQTMVAQMSADPVLTAALTDINALYDSFMNSLLQVNSSTGVIGSASVIQGYRLAKLLKGTQCDERDKDDHGRCPSPSDDVANWKQKPAFILLASVVNAGGTQHDHKTLWTALSTGDKITYSGGVVVNVFLWSAGSRAPIYVDVLPFRVPFSNLK